jgi:hypothetical protein
VPILGEEYVVHVYIGSAAQVMRAAQRRLARAGLQRRLLGSLDSNRGIAWNCLPDHNPIIGVRSDLAQIDAAATLAHEASHALGHIAKQTGLDDEAGEFRAHGISAVLRLAGPHQAKRRRGKG